MKYLGKNPPGFNDNVDCTKCGYKGTPGEEGCHCLITHYKETLLEIAKELEQKNFILTDRIKLNDWALALSKKIRVSTAEPKKEGEKNV